MCEAGFNGQVNARSDRTEVVEGNHNIPLDDVDQQYLRPLVTSTTCSWKGQPGYYTVEVDGIRAPDAAWTYHTPRPAASQITDHVASWRGVVVASAAS